MLKQGGEGDGNSTIPRDRSLALRSSGSSYSGPEQVPRVHIVRRGEDWGWAKFGVVWGEGKAWQDLGERRRGVGVQGLLLSFWRSAVTVPWSSGDGNSPCMGGGGQHSSSDSSPPRRPKAICEYGPIAILRQLINTIFYFISGRQLPCLSPMCLYAGF